MTAVRALSATAAAALALIFAAPGPADASCKSGRCSRNVTWAPGAQKTSFGGIAPGARMTRTGVAAAGVRNTSYGVARGTSTPFGVMAPGARTTSYGVARGTQTSFGLIAPGAHTTSYGVLGGQKTSFGAMGSNCRRTPFGVQCSDMRLKRDIVALDRLGNGLALYRFRYRWSDEIHVGVMAQDVARLMPSAVLRGGDGYLRVDYAQLGLRMQTWDEWTAAGRMGAAE